MNVFELIKEKLEEEKGEEDVYTYNEDKRLVRQWNNCVDKCKEIVDEVAQGYNNGWKLCSLEMPKAEVEVLIMTENGTVTTAMYEDGTISEDDSCWWWNDIEFDYDEETDTNYIPKGWWEYRHFNGDDVYNNPIDTKVVFWQPLPARYKEGD